MLRIKIKVTPVEIKHKGEVLLKKFYNTQYYLVNEYDETVGELTRKGAMEMYKLIRFYDEPVFFETAKEPVYIPKEKSLTPKKIICSDPATIIIWEDGDKTMVKCQDGEPYDPEKGIALCYMKRVCGDTGKFNDVLKEWIAKNDEVKARKEKKDGKRK